MVVDIAKDARCILQHAQVVETRPRSPSSLVRTGPCIAAIATSRKEMVGAAPITDRAGSPVSDVLLSPGDSFERVLKQFNRKIQNAGILSEARRRRHYESPQARRKRKAEAQRRRRQRSSR
jgi:small subunit ribosomal protein S21